MISTVQIVTPPTSEPLSLDLVRQHCRIDQQGDDALLAGYLTAARSMAEQYLGRVLLTQTLLWTLTPEAAVRPSIHLQRGALRLPRSPVQSISSVSVMDQRGNATTLALASLPLVPPGPLLGYRTDLAQQPPRVYLGSDTLLIDGRALRQVELEYLQIQFVAGYGATGASVPQPILDAILLYCGFLYEHRGDGGVTVPPPAAEWLMDPYRVMGVG